MNSAHLLEAKTKEDMWLFPGKTPKPVFVITDLKKRGLCIRNVVGLIIVKNGKTKDELSNLLIAISS